MAYTVDWLARTIVVPVSDLTLVSGTRYQLDMADFLMECRRLEWEPTEGLWAAPILLHTDAQIDFAGADYAGFDKIINGYTVEFALPAQRVDLLGSNNNIVDVLVGNVSVVPSNSAGLQRIQTGSGLTTAQSLQLEQVHGQVDRALYIDTTAAINGNGYQQSPYNNIIDLLDDAEANGIGIVKSFDEVLLSRSFRNIAMDGIGLPLFRCGGHSLTGSKFRNVRFKGVPSGAGSFIIQESQIEPEAGLYGYIEKSVFTGDVELVGSTHIVKGISGKEGAGYISINTKGFTLQITDWHRSLGISNMTGGIHTVEMYGGQLHIGSDCTGGTIYLRGQYSLPPNINPAATTVVIDQTETKKILDLHQRMDLDPNDPNIYSDDGSLIQNDEWRLEKTDLGNGTFRVQLVLL